MTSAAAAQDFTTLKGHGGPIMGLAVTPDDKVATASFDNSLGVWDGRAPTWLEGHDAAVTALLALPDGQLASGGDDFAVMLWDGPQGRVLGRHKGKVTSLALSPDGRWLASGSWDGTVGLWPLQTGTARTLHINGNVNDIAFVEEGAGLLVATSQGRLSKFDVSGEDTPHPLVNHGFGINELVIGQGWIAYGAVDGGTRIVSQKDGAPLHDFTLDRRPVLAMVHHPETDQLAVGDGEGFIMIIDTKDWRIARDFKATRKGPVWALAFSQDGQTIHAGGLDDVAYSWPVALLGEFEPGISGARSFLRAADEMPNGERQFMRKCSICHALDAGPSRKAGPTLYNVFGRRAGALEGYRYSQILDGSDIVWTETTIDALFDEGPDHYIPGSKMPMQVIAKPQDRADLIAFLKEATTGDGK
ncbi:c-type cytochrome [Primorskyibacter sp. S187A]|uniref:c-type cytochrome n=1 Tax=Primorskyibacter sp. S187A TaxID=3415130 RepID=UPI003C7A5D97